MGLRAHTTQRLRLARRVAKHQSSKMPHEYSYALKTVYYYASLFAVVNSLTGVRRARVKEIWRNAMSLKRNNAQAQLLAQYC